MRENVALRYGFSYFRQARPDIPCENTRYVRLETDFRSKETRQVFFFGTGYKMASILVQKSMLNVNYFLSAPITIFPYGLFI